MEYPFNFSVIGSGAFVFGRTELLPGADVAVSPADGPGYVGGWTGERGADLVLVAAAATTSEPAVPGSITEIAGPREENLVEAAKLLVASRGDPTRVEAVSNPDDPATELYEGGALLPGPDAILAGPTFEEWLSKQAA